ncbi:glycosyltransferase family 2 protein [Actinoplanes sp. NPDC051859]|uniref:glycosyltransferase family 2 protein n=1 Tax=Actinoplanes sp. NPDC051859 TaxID=3363909 RepID=UPI00378BA8B3
MRLSIVVPCFNEQDVIELFDERIRATLDDLGVEYELCYVDDGSSDATLDRLRALAESHEGTRFVSFSRNFGKEAGMLAGLREATGDAVVLMDADLQHPPQLIQRMLELYHQGHDQVVARRTREGDRFVRSLLSRMYYRLINRMVDVELTDGVGDFRLLSRPAVDALLSLPEYNRFSKGLFSWIGFNTVTFDYRNVAREAGATKWRFGALLNYGIDGLISFNNRPLRLGIYIGFVLAALAGLYAAWITVAAVAGGIETPGYVTLLVAIVGLGGLHMAMLGLVGEYIGRIYYESKRRPHFLIKETNVPREAFRGQGAGSLAFVSQRATAPQGPKSDSRVATLGRAR